MDIYEESLKFHEEKKGKICVNSKVQIKNKHDLSLAYTPGVAQPCKEIEKDKNLVYKYTMKGNTVAVITDGSAVLGLGNIGAYASIPVMEGKALLFKEFADIDAFPICLENRENFVQNIKNISPIFGGINLEDISAPFCFEVEEQLQDLGIPVMHDDQHGTAVVVLAALINSCKVTNKKFEDLIVVINGAGAAGYAIAKLLNIKEHGKVKKIIICDTKGVIYEGRPDLKENKYKKILSEETNPDNLRGTLKDAIVGANVFIGVSAPNTLTGEMVKTMKDPIIFAMSNPIPEIMPDIAESAGAIIVGTGRSDFPNQINNVLAFPGIFKGALDANATKISEEMKLSAANALASYVKNPKKDFILPSPLDKNVAFEIAKKVKETAIKQGIIRKN